MDHKKASTPLSTRSSKMLYIHATIITVDRTRRIITDGAIRVQGNLISDLGKSIDLISRYSDDKQYDLEGHIVIPGLISTHMHTAQTLLRGTADDLELVSWLCERIWVLQGNFTARDGYVAARLSIGEMLKGGTTCFLESMVCFFRYYIVARKKEKRSGVQRLTNVSPLNSSPIDMALMVLRKPLKRVVSADVLVRSLWIPGVMQRMMLGLCIRV